MMVLLVDERPSKVPQLHLRPSIFEASVVVSNVWDRKRYDSRRSGNRRMDTSTIRRERGMLGIARRGLKDPSNRSGTSLPL